MRVAKAVIVAGAALMFAGAADKPVELPEWMAGCWIETRGESWFEECWTVPRAGILIGSGRSGHGARLASWEAMQIVLEPETGAAFYGAPQGEGRTRFAWQPSEGDSLAFVNPAHDYPQRVRYWREGDRLVAEVSLIDGSKAMRWNYRRQGAGE